MLEAKQAYERKGLKFGEHALAVTGKDSELDRFATQKGGLKRFPMWDWVGGRTSVTSAGGLVPAALQGIEIDNFLAGAKECDELTRRREISGNPAAQLALAWFFIGKGKGERDMVILPYKDRLELFSTYLQQLVIETFGREKDLHANTVNQDI